MMAAFVQGLRAIAVAAVGLLVIPLVALGVATSARSETVDGRRAVIIDGDTFTIGLERVRILNIDAPETRGSHCERELVMALKAKERLASIPLSASLLPMTAGRRTATLTTITGLSR